MEYSGCSAITLATANSSRVLRVRRVKVIVSINPANDIYYEFYDMIEPYFAFRMK
jgi:hypothetical protein